MRTHTSQFEFLPLGLQYYVGGRFLALQLQTPVAGNLLHHAIELFLKAALSDLPIKKLRSRKDFGHDLLKLWAEFSQRSGGSNEQHVKAINDINKFEEIRYPSENVEELSLHLAIFRQKDGKNMGPSEAYSFVLEEVDSLVSFILSYPKISGFINNMTAHFSELSKNSLLEANKYPII